MALPARLESAKLANMEYPDAYPTGSPQYRAVTVGLFLAGFVTFALLYATQPLLPELASQFGLSAATAALSVSVTTLGLGVGLLVAGAVSESRGRTPIMFASLFASSVLGIACGLVPSWPTMLVLRSIEGFTLAGLPAVAMAYLSEEIDPLAQPRAAGIYVGGTALGGMSARLVNALLTDLFGWRVALSGIGVAALVAALVAFKLLPRSRHFVAKPTGLTQVWATTKAIGADRALLGLFTIGGLGMGAFVGLFNAIGFRLEGEYHLPVALAGLVYLTYAIGSWASARAGTLVSRRGHRSVAPWCALVYLAGIALTLASPLVVLVLAMGLVCAGFFALHAVASGWVAVRAQTVAGAPGQASSGYLFCYYLGSSIFGVVISHAYSGVGWLAVAAWAAALIGLAFVVTLLLGRTRPAKTP